MIERRLLAERVQPHLALGQAELIGRAESLVIVGEAGTGKTELAKRLALEAGVPRYTARQLMNRKDPRGLVGDAQLVVIDALDEATVRRDGEAVDKILEVLEALGYPRFILTCRAADWRGATGLAAFEEQYSVRPLELRLLPFTLEDARIFLTTRIGSERAIRVMSQYEGRGLAELLGNPQTLTMLADVALHEDPPANIGTLFERYVEIAWSEHSDQQPDRILEDLGVGTVLDALGAGFGALILTGSEAISRLPRSRLDPADIALGDAAALPGAGALADALRSRLAPSAGPERFAWPHRRVGEFLAARWLAGHADTPRKRRRLLALFHDSGLVPVSLRGLHAWLAWHSPEVAADIIAADPMGVIEYGDADAIAVVHGSALLAALQKLAAADPWFMGRGTYSAQVLVQQATLPEVRRLVMTPATPLRLRLLLIKQFAASRFLAQLEDLLHSLVFNPKLEFIIRREAAHAIVQIEGRNPARLVSELCAEESEDALRLGLEIADEAGYFAFGDALLARVIVGVATHRDTVGLYWRIERELPDDRLAGVLDQIAAQMGAVPREPDEYIDDLELTALAYSYIARCVALGGVEPVRLWSWLRPFRHYRTYRHDEQQHLASLLADDEDLRRAVQHHALFGAEDDKPLYQRGIELAEYSPGLGLSADDVLHHMETREWSSDPDAAATEQWKDLVQLTRHDGEEGRAVREAAKIGAAGKPELLEWLEKMGKPRVYEWQIRREARRSAEAIARDARRGEQRARFGRKMAEMRSGQLGWLSQPAHAYLRMHSEVDRDLPAHERVAEWLGADIAAAAFEGFEAFLQLRPPWPNAARIAEDRAAGERCPGSALIVAALGERMRSCRGVADLPDERLVAGLYSLLQTPYEQHAGLDGLRAALESEIGARGLQESALRGWYEPQFIRRRDPVSELYGLLREGKLQPLASVLAIEWLERYPDLPDSVEFELVDFLIRIGRSEDIRSLLERRGGPDMPEARRHSWDAIEFWLDFDRARARIDSGLKPAPDLLWHLRGRLGGGRWMGEDSNQVHLSPAQLAWIIDRFRGLWPMAYMPSGGSEGHHNGWDAADYIRGLILRLGNDISDDGVRCLVALRDAPTDGYTEHLSNAAAEQQRKRVEQHYLPARLSDVAAVLKDGPPRSASDLQSVILEEIDQLARRLAPGGDNANPITGFYDGITPKGEDACRDHLLTLLRGQLPFSIMAEPEGEAADGKANDIACSLGRDLMVPIEIKGQWHAKLWQAADTQLRRLYASDWRADRRGIYLVLWFGGAGKALQPPPGGAERPASAGELCTSLKAASVAARAGSVVVKVLDLSR